MALSENLSQIHPSCGKEGKETLLLREKDFERENAEPKKKQEREREREKQKSKEQKQRAKTKRERAFFSFFRFTLLSVSCVFSLLFALVFLSIFFLSR